MQRATHITRWAVGSVAAVVALLLGAGAALNTDPGRRAAERITAWLTHDRVQLRGLAGRFPDHLQLASLQIGDSRGRWLDAEGIALRWSPLRLLRRQVSIDSLSADRVDIERAPVTDRPSPPSSGDSWWRGFELGRLEVPQLTLGEALAGTPASLSVRASGRLIHADDAAIDIDATQSNGSGRYTLTYRADAGGLDGALHLDEPDDGPLAHLLQVPGLGAIHVAATLAGARNLPRVQLDATLGALHANANGTVDWRQRTADLTLAAHSGSMAPRTDLGWRQLIDGRWQGGIAAPTATATAVIAGLRAAGGSAVSIRAEARSSAGALHVTAQADGMQIPGDHPQLLAGAPLQLQADTDLRAQPRRVAFSLTHPLLQARGDATFDRQTEVRASLQLSRLEALGVLAGVPLAGNASLNARYQGSGAEGRIDADGALRVTGGSAPLPALIGNDGKLKIAVAWNGTRLHIDDAQLTGTDFTASASGGRSERGEWDLAWRAAVANLTLVSAVLQGKASADGSLRGAPADLTTEAHILADASISGSPRAPLEARLNATHLATEPQARLDVHGTLDQAPLQISAALHRDAARTVHVEVTRGEWKSARLSGQMAWPAMPPGSSGARPQPAGRLELRIARLDDLHRFTGQSLPGQLTVRVDSPAAGNGTLQWEVDAQNVQFQALSADAQIHASGTTEQLALNVAMQLRGAPGGDAQLTGAAALNLPQKHVTVSALHVDYQKQRLELRSPAQIDFADGVAIQNLRATWQDAQIQIDGRVLPALSLRASLRNLSPALFAPHLQAAGIDAAQLPAEGRLALQTTLSGALDEPHGTVALQATDLRWRNGVAAAVPALNVTAQAELQGAEPANLSAQVRSGTGTELTVGGQVPLTAQGALALHLQGRADLGLANGFLEAGGRHASGQATLDATLTGTFAEPQISGQATIANGELRDYVQGIRLTAISASLEAHDRALQIASFTARAGRGQVSGSGSIGVLQAGLPIDVKFAFANAEPIASNIITAQLDGTLQLRGTLDQRLDLSGNLQVRRAEVTIPNALPVTVATLDVRRPGRKQPVAPPSRFDLGFDLAVNAPQGVFVRGRGLDAELGGELHLSGTQDALQVSGGFELREGRFNLAGQSLDFQSGRVSFTGEGIARQLDPSLDFIASNVSSGVTSTLKISGYADQPVITLESSPELPQDEVLSHLLFGQSVTQLNALQLARMAAALASLGGIGSGGAGALLGLQRSLGLDRLAVGSSGTDTGGATVEAGRYISRRVYVGTKQSTAGGTQAEVEIDVSKRLKLHTSFGNNASTAQGAAATDQSGNTVGLSYEFEY